MWLIRTGALRQMSEAAAKDTSIRKADAAPRPLSPDEIATDHDILLSSMGGRRLGPDGRAERIAKAEADERYVAAVRKADATRDAALEKDALILPTEEKRRKEAGQHPPPATAEDKAGLYSPHNELQVLDTPGDNPKGKPPKRVTKSADGGPLNLASPATLLPFSTPSR